MQHTKQKIDLTIIKHTSTFLKSASLLSTNTLLRRHLFGGVEAGGGGEIFFSSQVKQVGGRGPQSRTQYTPSCMKIKSARGELVTQGGGCTEVMSGEGRGSSSCYRHAQKTENREGAVSSVTAALL